jgi:hypothetical protein
MLAVSAVSTITGAQAQSKAANAQAKAMANEQQNTQNQLALGMNQEAAQAASEMNARNKSAMEEAAAFDAMSGEFGGGVSADRASSLTAFNRNSDLSGIAGNRNMKLAQMGQQAQGSGAAYKSKLASLERPSRLGVALTIAGQAAGAYAGSAARSVGDAPGLGVGTKKLGAGGGYIPQAGE